MSRHDHTRDPTFSVSHGADPGRTLIAGFSSFGLAGLTAVDFLADQLALEQTGHITVDQLPAITPFEAGTPRHHTRLFSREDLDVTVLSNELFVPVSATAPFGEAILEWVQGTGIEEVVILTGVPVPHGPEEHQTFFVATEGYQSTRLADADAEIPGMGSGFLDGVNAEMVAHGLETDVRVGVFVTPVHPQTPDVAAAIRLLETVGPLYDLGVDTEPLESFAADVERYYRELADRVRETPEEQQPADRMYM